MVVGIFLCTVSSIVSVLRLALHASSISVVLFGLVGAAADAPPSRSRSRSLAGRELEQSHFLVECEEVVEYRALFPIDFVDSVLVDVHALFVALVDVLPGFAVEGVLEVLEQVAGGLVEHDGGGADGVGGGGSPGVEGSAGGSVGVSGDVLEGDKAVAEHGVEDLAGAGVAEHGVLADGLLLHLAVGVEHVPDAFAAGAEALLDDLEELGGAGNVEGGGGVTCDLLVLVYFFSQTRLLRLRR